jgi:hypothetical protein
MDDPRGHDESDDREVPAPDSSFDSTEKPPILSYRSGPPGDRPVLPYYSGPPQLRLVTIRRLGSMEAQLAQAKLESEGIPCFVLDQNIATAHPLLVTEVKLQVAEADALRAEEILSQPVANDAEGEYADEDWRCPKCKQKKVDLLPLSKAGRRARAGCLTVLLLPLILLLMEWLFSGAKFARWIDQTSESLRFVWVGVLLVLSIIVITLKRQKRCRACGHEWVHGN